MHIYIYIYICINTYIWVAGSRVLRRLVERVVRRLVGRLVRRPLPQAPQHGSKIASKIGPVFSIILARFSEPKCFKNSPRSGFTKKREQKTQKREIALPLNENPCFLGTTWSQNGPKMKPNPCQEASENDVGKMTSKLHQKCSQNSSQNNQKITKICKLYQRDPN